MEIGIYVTVFVLWTLTTIQGGWALLDGFRFYRYVKRMIAASDDAQDSNGEFKYQPKVALILPCCGVDQRLEHTVEALRRQNYQHYEVFFTFESTEDPAYGEIGRWARDWTGPPWHRVVAGMAERRSQKIHNLLAAISKLSDKCDVIIFLDSDAIPHPDWMGHLVEPLQDQQVGAATGFRWYTASGGVAAGIRSAWNAASVSMLHNDLTNFCWGGSTAIRKSVFERLSIAQRWDSALSDDYQVTRAVRDAGLAIRFVPQALLPTNERTTFANFWNFARRQFVITRICGPKLWLAGFVLCFNFIIGATSVFLLFVATLFDVIGDQTTFWLALSGWLFILSLAGGKALIRQLAVRRILQWPNLSWRDLAWDVLGVGPIGTIHLALLLASARSRRFVWRNKVYEMISPDSTRILERRTADDAPAIRYSPARTRQSR